MKITDQKRDSFINMMEKFACKHGLSIQTDYKSHTPNILKVEIGNPKTRRWEYYSVNFDNEYSLTEAAAPIMADVLSKWKLGDMADRPSIEKVLFKDPATIIFWSDDTKTVVVCQDGDIYDPEKGLAMAIAKKYLGNRGSYCNEFKKWLPKEKEDKPMVVGAEVNDRGVIARIVFNTSEAAQKLKESLAGVSSSLSFHYNEEAK